MSGFGSNWSDGEMLAALDAVEFQGMSRAGAAGYLSQYLGRRITRQAVIGLVHGITGARLSHGCVCQKPENIDGGMPVRWWECGAARQAQTPAVDW